jgi:hypothetical protein
MWQASFVRYPANATLQHSFRIAINKLQMRPGQWRNFTAALKPGRHFTFKKATLLAMRKKQRYGGLSPRHVCLIRDYLHTAYHTAEAWDARNVWIWLLLNSEPSALARAKAAGLGQRHVNALKAGIGVLKRKRLGRLCDWNPKQSFAAIGSQAPARAQMTAAEQASILSKARRSGRSRGT